MKKQKIQKQFQASWIIYLLTGFYFQQSSALKIQLKQKNAQASLAFFLLIVFIRDLDWIQTSNLLSRNQMRYSVAPRGLVAGANIAKIDRYPNRKLKNNGFFWTTTNFNIYLPKSLQVT